jgi:hypothetical protein
MIVLVRRAVKRENSLMAPGISFRIDDFSEFLEVGRMIGETPDPRNVRG